MTHGSGSIHGGHGSFSSNSTSGSGADICTCCFCTFFAVVFCAVFEDLSPRHKFRLVWIIVALGSIVSGFCVAFEVFGNYRLDISPADERLLYLPGTTTFCSKQSVQVFDSQSYGLIHTYLLATYPTIGPQIQLYEFNHSSYIPHDNYQYFGHYLLKGSSISVQVKAKGELDRFQTLTVFLIFEKSNLEDWLDDHRCSSCYSIKKEVTIGTEITFNKGVADSGEYYVLLAAFDRPVWYQLDIKLQKTTYDLSSTVKNCTGSEQNGGKCTFEFDFNSNQVLLVRVDGENFSSYTDSVRITSGSNSIVYVTLFLLIPLILLLSAVLIRYFILRSKMETEQDRVKLLSQIM